MVVAQHIGRLGNNMFQIAAAIGYARKYGYKWAADERSGLSEPYSSIHKVFPNLPKSPCNGRKYNEHPNAFCHQHGCHFDICHFDYHDLLDRGNDVTLFGFYQSLKYFENVQDEVKKVFALERYPEYEKFTSIHVRRGDYVQYSGSFPPITSEYVRLAMNKIRVQDYLVFSDDIGWCKENLAHLNNSFHRFEFVDEPNERKSLSMMASCANHIIANSSFSWWGGYLGHNPDKMIVAPAQSGFNWFGPKGGVKNPKTLIPDTWIQIEFR